MSVEDGSFEAFEVRRSDKERRMGADKAKTIHLATLWDKDEAELVAKVLEVDQCWNNLPTEVHRISVVTVGPDAYYNVKKPPVPKSLITNTANEAFGLMVLKASEKISDK